ncbi:transglycosylase SLT domain-containing protein [Streptomyces sp. NPDC020965]|uniref:LysM peptidoglycan-binding domain-containing protein n=1 Tax=Streptomyces sp. NPDC020965 TaxID=3365105 RepID=UPI00379C64C9
MPAHGKHRRAKNSSFGKRIMALGVGGAVLALPVWGATTAHAAPATASATHSVVAGDTLASIAEQHGIDGGWQWLYEANREALGDDPGVLRPGLTLAIGWAPESTGASEADATTEAAEPAAATEPAAEPAAEAAPASAPEAAYTDDLDGWIKESLAVLAEHGIPGSYEGIHRNIMRESSGDPQAINNWDSNAAAGTPSKGLLQVIDPTFEAYHVPGTSLDSFDPVANITAACNYAADRYGSIDNVFGPY